jgi:RimJ/RimL family protein N-acetyltransferase
MFPDLTRDDVFRVETRRLWLRWPRQADAAAIVRQAGEKAVAEMTSSIPHPLALHQVEDVVLRARRANAEGLALTMAIAPRSRPADLVGVIAIEPKAHGLHLGYWIGAAHWGKGLATEAARALVDAFFAYTEGRELVAAARVINPASRRVLEKSGFAHVGSGLEPFPARGGVLPVDRFRLDRRGWESLKDWRSDGLVIGRPKPETQMEAAVPA